MDHATPPAPSPTPPTLANYAALRFKVLPISFLTGFLVGGALTGVIHRVRRLSLNNAILIWTREPVPIVWRAAEEAVSSAGIATYTSRRIVDSQLSKYSARAREARRPQAQDGSGPLMEELASTQDLTPDMKDSARSTADEGVSRPASFDQRREHDFRDPYFRPGTPRREV